MFYGALDEKKQTNWKWVQMFTTNIKSEYKCSLQTSKVSTNVHYKHQKWVQMFTTNIKSEYKYSLQTSKGFLFFISIEICYNIHDLMPVIVELILRLYAYVRWPIPNIAY